MEGGGSLKVPNSWFDEIGNPAVGMMNRALVDQNFQTLRTCTIPGFRTQNGQIDDFEIILKISIT